MGKKLTDYVNVVEMLKRFESGFLVKQAKTFTPQEVRLNFKKMLKFFFQYSSFVFSVLYLGSCLGFPADSAPLGPIFLA